MAQHWLAYHQAHSEENPFPYAALEQSIVYMKEEFRLNAGDIIWMIQGEKVNSKETLFTLVDCFTVHSKTIPPSQVSVDFSYAYTGKKSLLTAPIEWDKTNENWILIHAKFLKNRPGLRTAKTIEATALKNISGITKF
ncbi:hypothetical protein KWE92_04005 [Acinetobacter pittii]|uniref:hypothetical protein n=1 Tax=Acinetobacter pittii TaxID=48296 RepID=UPI00355BA471